MFRFCVPLRSAVIKTAQTGKVMTLTINRPESLNALNREVVEGIIENLLKFNKDPSVSAFILTGEGRAFVAGADIKAMKEKNFVDYVKDNDFQALDYLPQVTKPIIAAVNGFALGGGCELAMACDIIIASEKAKFGQPEINLGTIPGLGGTQRLTRAIGKARAMEWVLTGQVYTAAEAERAGLVSRVVKHEELMPTAIKTAEIIASKSQVTTLFAKQAVNAALETSLQEGLRLERTLFNATFATADRKEGMTAFAEKREPSFKNE